jgi:hypothetical protein
VLLSQSAQELVHFLGESSYSGFCDKWAFKGNFTPKPRLFEFEPVFLG